MLAALQGEHFGIVAVVEANATALIIIGMICCLAMVMILHVQAGFWAFRIVDPGRCLPCAWAIQSEAVR